MELDEQLDDLKDIYELICASIEERTRRSPSVREV